MIPLVEKITTGSERDVYFHPDDDSLIIKINRPDTSRDINRIEYECYLSHIANTELAQFFPRMPGWQETLAGPGLVMDCVRDHDGRISRSLDQALAHNLIEYPLVRKKLDKVARLAIEHGLLMRELDAVNILICRKDDRNEFDVVLVDGFGPVRRSLKSMIRRRIPLLSRMKARKSWKHQMALLDACAAQAKSRA
jgi:hypothetical protein